MRLPPSAGHQLAVPRRDAGVRSLEQVGVEQRVAGGEQHVRACSPGHLGDGGALGERVRHPVELAALQRHLPAAFAGPAPFVLDEALGHTVPLEHGVDEQLVDAAERAGERRIADRPRMGTDLVGRVHGGERGGHDGRPGGVRPVVLEQHPAVARDGPPERPARQGDPGVLRRPCAWWRYEHDVPASAASPAAAAGVDEGGVGVAVALDRHRRLAVVAVARDRAAGSRSASGPGRPRRAPGSSSGVTAARPSAPVAPRVNRGWISPTQR